MFETQGRTRAESNPRPSEEGVSFYHVLRPLDQVLVCFAGLLCLVLHCFLRLSHALYCGSRRWLAFVAFSV